MARRATVLANISSLLSNLSPAAQANTLAFLQSVAVGNENEDIGEIEVSTRAARRKARAAAKAEAAKPARGTRSTRKAAEDEKPVRKTRTARKAADEEDEAPVRRARKPKVEAFDGEVTVDDLYDVLDNFEGEPVEGTIRELKPLLEALGADVAGIYEAAEEESGEKLTSKEKAVELGVHLAAMQALSAKIVATLKEDEEAFDDIIEELDLELSETARPGTIAKAIIEAINAETGDEDEDEGDDEDDADEEEEEEEVAPRRKRSAAKVAEKPARGSKRKSAKDDLEDLDALDD